MARRTLCLPVRIAAVVAVACAVALSAVSEKAEATFPGKNGRIAYTSYENDYEIYTINPGGGGKFQVTNNTTTFDDEPSYSPDGKKIVYQANVRRPSVEVYTIYTINVGGGGGKSKVTHGYDPSYSPDGKRIAYTSSDGHDLEIYTINVGGGGKKRLTNNTSNDEAPSYSPDGKRIAYAGVGSKGYNSEIYTINAGGGGKFNVTNNTLTYDYDPSYSPDGKRIAYASYGGRDPEIYTINVGGGRKEKLTDNDTVDEQPSWGIRG
jgi:Tol biopolymer transport system component